MSHSYTSFSLSLMTWSGPQGEIINQTGRHVRQSLELGTSTNSSEMSVKVHNGHVCQSNMRDVTSQLRDSQGGPQTQLTFVSSWQLSFITSCRRCDRRLPPRVQCASETSSRGTRVVYNCEGFWTSGTTNRKKKLRNHRTNNSGG